MAILKFAQGIDDEGGPPSQRGGTRDGDKPGYIGVPQDYTARAPRQQHPNYYPHGYSYSRGSFGQDASPMEPVDIRPRYIDGDEWKPASWNAEMIASLQSAMAAAGLIGPRTSIRLGMWDESSRNAYKELLSFANASGLDVNTALARYRDTVTVGGGEGGGGFSFDEEGNIVPDQFVAPPLQLQLPNRADVEKVLRTAVIEKLGAGWSQEQIAQLADLYIGQVRGVQEAAYRQEVDRMEDEFYGRPGSSEPIVSVEAPSLETFAEDELRRRDPGGFEATQVAEDYAPAFFAALSGYT